ncbi:MAG: FecR domain-containing protein [Prevotella sp.]|nr:FecR domain-containing protein [Prevotella sp.]
MTDEILNIMQPESPITDEQLAMIDSNADLREACEDVMMLQGMLAEKPDTEAALQRFHEKHRKSSRRWLYWSAASVVAALFAGALFLLWTSHHSAEEAVLAQQSSVASKSSDEAILDGSSVTLTAADGEQQAITVEKSKDAADEVINVVESQLTLSNSNKNAGANSNPLTSAIVVPYGHSVLVHLSDGTRVYLRPGSKLIYPDKFIGDYRVVSLKGEAYFCVAHNPERPFVVGTPQGIVQDYGTEFNVTTEGDKTQVVLVEGSVGVKPTNHHEQLLQPGQMATFDANHPTPVIEKVDTDPYTAWRDGYFYFNEQTLGDIITQLACSYNLKVECHNTDILRLRLRYIIPRSSTAAYAVEILNRLQTGHIQLQGDRIVIR